MKRLDEVGGSVGDLLQPLKGFDDITGVERSETYTVYVRRLGENKIPLVTLYPGTRHAKFHKPFDQVGGEMEELKPFINKLDAQGYTMNLN